MIVISALLGGYFIPADRRLGPMVQREIDDAGPGEISLSTCLPSTGARAGWRASSARSSGILLIVAVYLMVTKPGVLVHSRRGARGA